ncbi:putative protein phosphatase 2C 13 [Zea mays]|uniref:protein-serine/threonine phosphatase n=2 Tax=Zea mays TaxID=4577 RepID=A0A3L6D688_MAIZE|nr:putative protein phosphatase 2C 13 [Zea mays]PWZ11358.1 putative protein phosphatase 2C 13 [Zea mays]
MGSRGRPPLARQGTRPHAAAIILASKLAYVHNSSSLHMTASFFSLLDSFHFCPLGYKDFPDFGNTTSSLLSTCCHVVLELWYNWSWVKATWSLEVIFPDGIFPADGKWMGRRGEGRLTVDGAHGAHKEWRALSGSLLRSNGVDVHVPRHGTDAAQLARISWNKVQHLCLSAKLELKTGETYQKTDIDFLESEASTFRDDGSTASTAILVGDRLYVANVGDSCAVIPKAGKAMALSEDHKPNRIDERKRIENACGIVIWADCKKLLLFICSHVFLGA